MSHNDDKELLLTFIWSFSNSHFFDGDYVIAENAEWILTMQGLTKVPGPGKRRYNDAFLSTAEVANVVGVHPSQAGELLKRLELKKSEREGYRISELVETARRLGQCPLESGDAGR